MSGLRAGPEVALISQSIENANARIRFFRVAFGIAGDDQEMSRQEISSILQDISAGGRIQYEWSEDTVGLRRMIQPVFLAAMCLENALPLGGTISISRAGQRWIIRGAGERVTLDEGLRYALMPPSPDGTKTPANTPAITPAQVQFALLPQTIDAIGRRLALEITETAAHISF